MHDTTGCALGYQIETYTGRFVDITEIKPSDVNLLDVAHALSMSCRFNGHTSKFFSVAEHSVNVSWLVPKEMALAGLLHDGSEAFLCDIPRPIKPFLTNYYELEAKVQAAIYERFGVGAFCHETLKEADNIALKAEAKALVKSGGKHWQMSHVAEHDVPINCWTPKRAKREFLNRFAELY
jgi:5'-deoxynucleotidase YfbR-like HD superfamily hydrolase